MYFLTCGKHTGRHPVAIGQQGAGHLVVGRGHASHLGPRRGGPTVDVGVREQDAGAGRVLPAAEEGGGVVDLNEAVELPGQPAQGRSRAPGPCCWVE